MPLSLILALQAAASAEPPPPRVPPRIDFDLADYRPGGLDDPWAAMRGCTSDDPSAVLVCGRRQNANAYPIGEWAAIFATRRLVAETRIGNMIGGAYVQSVELAPGMTSNRALIGLRVPF